MRLRFVSATVVLASVLPSSAQAVPIPIGVAGGTLAVHYNAGMPETPANQAYIKAQFSETNTNGAAFSFLSPPGMDFAAIFGDVGQFGLDLVLPAPTNDGSLGPLPFPVAVDYDGAMPVPAGPVAFALNDYKPDAVGPGVPTNVPFNSLFRGLGIELTTFAVTPVMGGFSLAIAGKLTTDGLIHWFSPAAGTTALSDVGLLDFVTFEGGFLYETAADTTDGIDFYSGEATFFANTAAVPEPSSAFLLFLGAAGFAGFRFRRKEQDIV